MIASRLLRLARSSSAPLHPALPQSSPSATFPGDEAILRAVWDDHPTRVFTYVARANRTEIDEGTGERVVRRAGRRYPFTPSILRDRWNEVREKLDLKALTWHGLRATFATRLLRAKERIELVRDLLGHADIRTTERYAVVLENDKREAMERAAKRKRAARKQRATSQRRHSGAAPKLKVVSGRAR
jgi:hypothetical protein